MKINPKYFSLLDTIDKVQSNSYRDIPVSDFNIIDPSSPQIKSNLLGINSPNRLTSFHSVSLGLIYGFGRRISKTVDGNTTYFIYDGDQLIEERDSTGRLLAAYTYGSGIDEALTMKRGSQTYFYHYDGLGSVREITDEWGNIEETYQYDVYGQPNQASQIGNRYLFTGREYDEETGLYYYRARYYSPSIGRFLQRDPYTWAPDDARNFAFSSFNNLILGILIDSFDLKNTETEKYFDFLKSIPIIILYEGSANPRLFNLYPYVNNNPTNYVDPKGTVVHIGMAAVIVVAHIGAFALGWFTPPGTPSPFAGHPWFQSLDLAYNLGGIAQGFFEKFLEWSEKRKWKACE